MERDTYLDSIEAGLKAIFKDYYFNNYKKQILARRLGADFDRTYNEPLLWNRALYLSSKACLLLLEDRNQRLAMNSLKEAAEIYEYFAQISETYDRDYCYLLSAFCYDLAGYQANAYCLLERREVYELETQDENNSAEGDNYILLHLTLILLKKITKARMSLNKAMERDVGVRMFNSTIARWYESILNGTDFSVLDDFQALYETYLNSSDVPMSQLLFLLYTRAKVFLERSVWSNLSKHSDDVGMSIWTKYIKLLTHDIYDRNNVKPIDERRSRFELWTSQLRALEAGLVNSDKDFVIQMPTSAGKTFIAEMAILDSLIKHPGKKCIYVAPFRALTNEKETELANYLSKLGYSVSALTGSYETDEFQDILLEDTDVLIATPEKIDLLMRLNSVYFEDVSLLVVDEGHIVGEYSARSSLTEFLIIRLRIKIPQLRILFISAVMPPENAEEYSIWLSGSRGGVIRSLMYPDSKIDEQWEPTRKLIGKFRWEGKNGRIDFKGIDTENEDTKVKTGAFIPGILKTKQFASRYPDGKDKAQTSASLALVMSSDGSCLVFCAQVPHTKSVALRFIQILQELDQINQLPKQFTKSRLTESYIHAKKWFGVESHVTKCVEYGIGVHFGNMPEPLRRSVESEYRAGLLKVLISTSTIGQGLNLPIKHLIIHSTIIYGSSSGIEKIQVRDFWNIIGRAGRAGKETEGQIIFVVNSYTDEKSFEEFSDQKNIEPAFSMFYEILRALFLKRLTQESFEEYTRILSEPYLLNLLAEEVVDTDDQILIEKIISTSLFKVQSDVNQLNVQPVKNMFGKICQGIRNDVNPELLPVFAKTGFAVESNQAIVRYINRNKIELQAILAEDDVLGLLRLIFALFDEYEVSEVNSDKLAKLGLNHQEFMGVVASWLAGDDIEVLQNEWRKISSNHEDLHILISDGFYFRYSWGITSFISILCGVLGIDRKDLSAGVKNLSSFIKFGLNNPAACLARSLGINNRQVAKVLAEANDGLQGRDFVKWIANLSAEEIDGFGLTRFDSENVANVATGLASGPFEEMPTFFSFFVKGIPFEMHRKKTSLLVKTRDVLWYERDPENKFDPFAIKIFYEANQLGFVPRDLSKRISVEIDINKVNYEIVVDHVEIGRDHNNVRVHMKQVKQR